MEHNRVIYSKVYDREVEYLECNQFYLQLQIKPSTNYTYRWGYKILQLSNWNYMFEAHKPARPWFIFGGVETNNCAQLHIASANNINGKILQENVLYNGILCKEGNKINEYLNNVLYVNLAYQDYTAPGDLYIIGKHVQLYYLQILNENNNIIFDAIPVRKGTEGYLYDKVSGKFFGNQGTDNFILGQDVSNPVPNIRRVFRFGNKRFVIPMPYDSRVEYLETTGTQWLNTGYYGDINTAMECVCKVTDTTYGYVIAGSRTSATVGNISLICGKQDNYYQYMCDFGDYTNSRLLVKESDVNDYVKLYTSANLRKAVDVVNETEYTNSYVISSASQTPYTIKICHHDGNYNASYKHFRGRIKSFKLWSSDTLLLDLIPVRIGTKGYMYDKVTGNLFGNSGTGQFTLGPDIND